MILVTGANGNYGKATINYLVEKGVSTNEIIALVRDTDNESVKTLTEKGIQVRVGDYDDYPSLLKCFDGINQLFFISGSDIGRRQEQHMNIISAAKENGVKHILYTSFQGKNITESSPLWFLSQSHFQTEKWLKECGIPFTLLKNNLYMDFIPAFTGENVIETGVIFLPAGTGKVGAVLRTEMAEASAVILLNKDLWNKTYNFSNSEAFSFQDVADLISSISKEKIKYISPSAKEYTEKLEELGLPSDFIGLFSSFAVAQSMGELETTSNDLEILLGRKPTTIKTFLSQVYS